MTSRNDAVERLKAFEPALISDCMVRLGLSGWTDGLLPLGGDVHMVGRARTLLYAPARGDGGLGRSIYEVIEGLAPGDVLVIATGGTLEGTIGDNKAAFAARCGLAGVVTDSPVRDTRGIAALAMPVFCRGASARVSQSIEPVALDVVVNCAGAQVHSGDYVIGNEDGLLVIPADRVDDILAVADKLAPIEKAVGSAIEHNASSNEIEAVLATKRRA